jgi:hypothetical protein
MKFLEGLAVIPVDVLCRFCDIGWSSWLCGPFEDSKPWILQCRYKELYIELCVEGIQIGKCSDFTMQIILKQMNDCSYSETKLSDVNNTVLT